MLRDAQGVENRRWRSGGIPLGRAADQAGLDAADLGRQLGGVGPDVLAQRLELLATVRDERAVVKAPGQDVMHHRVDEHVVRAVPVLDVEVRMLRHPGIPRIANDQPGPVAHGLLHLQADDGMRFGWIGADDEKGLHVLDLADRVGHRAGTEGECQSGDGRRVAGGGALVDIVGSSRGARQLLHEVVFLVRAARGTQERQAFRTVPVAGGDQCPSRLFDGLLPGCLAANG